MLTILPGPTQPPRQGRSHPNVSHVQVETLGPNEDPSYLFHEIEFRLKD